ncbi:Crp/Fnr family transcriptional regulator [Epilithonimonas xixisoli]|uniref:CRP-like cAMP-binding protein n=1 Tax=Epilithonimonas xixisoli TaxID=1476462 RepID=A0A4R8I4X8_9FLAO|nr:Crp/Fnr family transcriptional regulator [Epilithonimonas xixisoli]TDX82776.1 CRP-like cAMP-binding protein [Epilithonimonas xixisoli]
MSDFDYLINYAQNTFGLDDADVKRIDDYFEIQTPKKNEIILNSGEVCKNIYFVKKGILRTFHINSNGTEFTRLIVKENQFCTVLISFQEKMASPAFIQALEDCVLFRISQENFLRFVSQSENAKKIYTTILEEFQNFQIKRLEFLTQYSPQEKTEIFIKENPELESRITDKIIASYLQITPETYSRCKKKLES